MHSGWIQHVKKYQSDHGCSYKDAMCQSKKTYCTPSKSQSQTGGSAKTVIRKAVNTGKRVLPFIEALNPEMIAEIEGAKLALDIAKKLTKKKKTKSQTGGSFLVQGAGAKRRVKLSTSESSMISPHHPSFAPVKVKSYSRSLHEN